MSDEKNKTPEHVGIIMDGNRRWAKERNLKSFEGHMKGYEKLKLVPDWFFSRGVKIVSVFAFSAENWNRSREEVNYLMKLLKQAIENYADEFNQKGYRILISGRLNELPGDLPEACDNIMNKTKDNKNGTLHICLNYGGRSEIIDVIKKIVQNNISLEQIHEGMIKKYLYHGGLADPDIIVRTSGEQRISGFLLWQSAYSELMFIKKYWPDFEETDAQMVIDEYGGRKRRFGGDNK